MATMNVSLPDQMKDWVDSQTRNGRYSNASDYVRDLIRRDQDRVGEDKKPESGMTSEKRMTSHLEPKQFRSAWDMFAEIRNRIGTCDLPEVEREVLGEPRVRFD